MKTQKELKQIFDDIALPEVINFEKSFEFSKLCSELLSKDETVNFGRELVIRMLDAWERLDQSTHSIWNDLVEVAGLYPYLTKDDLSSDASRIRYEFHGSRYLKDLYLHEEQMKLSSYLESSKSVIVSAPTSFGKSILIEEVVASRRYNNIVIIQPTLALLDETRKKLRKYQGDYKIILSTNQLPSQKANLFLLTPERLVEYSELPQIDFFVIDEFYKLSMDRDDERAAVLNLAFYRLLKITRNFYLLGPHIQTIPDGFEETYNAKFIKTDFSTVAVDVNRIVLTDQIQKEDILFDLLIRLKGATLIFCSSPSKVNKLVSKFVDYCEKNGIIPDNKTELEKLDIIEWIDQNVHPEWLFKKALIYSVGMHHGALPRHVGSSIVDYFNQGEIKYLFCTSTLIEGVNTSAKNVILFDKKKGPKEIDYFDFKNIIGRSGRMKIHFIGKVYKFYDEPPSGEVEVDIPFYTQKDAESELLIQLSLEDVRNKDSELFKLINSLDPETSRLIKSNKGVSVEGQLSLINELENNLNTYHALLSWTGGVPNYGQLNLVVNLAWKHLLKKGESRTAGILTPAQLAFMTIKYNITKSLSSLIIDLFNSTFLKEKQPDEKLRIQEAINSALQMRRHWFEYKLPKLLKTVSAIQSFVFRKHNMKPGDYHYFADQIENNFLPQNLAVLLEYAIPSSAIKKIQKYIDKDVSGEDIINMVKTLDLSKINLIEYEINKIKNSL